MSDSASAPAKSAPPTPKRKTKAIPTHLEYIVADILPRYEVHLIGGPSGAGKTTLMFQLIEDWAQSKSVFGHDSFPTPFIYIPCDRSEDSTLRTMDRMGVTIDVPIYSLVDNNVPANIDTIVRCAQEQLHVKSGTPITIFIDAFGTLVPGGKINDYATVGSWLREVNRKCKREKITIIGMGHSTKTKEGEKFDNPRQRFLGSVAWGGFVDTMIFIEPENADDPTNTSRRILVLPRNSSELCLHYHFDKTGRLVDGEMEDVEFLLEAEIAKLEPSTPHPTEYFLELATVLNVPKRTCERWLSKAVDAGILERVKKGVYRRPHKN
jgi:RecA-family ATPase